MSAPSICLGLIVKNEEKVIERCLRSAAPYIDSYYILDTGSTDNTIEVIGEVADSLDLNGVVVESDWVDFGTSRSKMMSGARAVSSSEWLLQVDADWELVLDTNEPKNPFEALANYPKAHAAGLTIWDATLEWPLPMVTRMTHPWRYIGRVHEYLDDDGAGGITAPAIAGIKAYHRADGGSREGRHAQDVELLKSDNTTRGMFYYAQSLRATEQYEAAVVAYKIRAARSDGWDEEVYISLLYAGRCTQMIGREDEAIGLLYRAWAHRPSRIEALCTIIEIMLKNENWLQARNTSDLAVAQANAKEGLSDLLFVEKYRWDQINFLRSQAITNLEKEAKVEDQ